MENISKSEIDKLIISRDELALQKCEFMLDALCRVLLKNKKYSYVIDVLDKYDEMIHDYNARISVAMAKHNASKDGSKEDDK